MAQAPRALSLVELRRFERLGDLVQACLSIDGGSASEPEEALLARAREWPAKLLPTLLSAWSHEGRELGEDLADELERHRERARRYAAVASALRESHPNLIAIKGTSIAEAYPPPLVRQTNDLDYVVTDSDAVWRAAAFLQDSGMKLASATLVRIGDALHPLVSLERDDADPVLGVESVELTSVGCFGNFCSVGARPVEPSLLEGRAGALATVVAEGFERPFGARDLLDAYVLLSGDLDRGRLRHILERWSLEPELLSLLVSLRRAGLVDAIPRSVRQAAVASKSRRVLRASLNHLVPTAAVGRAQRRAVVHERTEGAILRQLGRILVVRPAEALRAGLPLWGLQVDERRHQRTDFESRRDVLLARTPAGSFAFVAGREVREEWLEAPTAEGGS